MIWQDPPKTIVPDTPDPLKSADICKVAVPEAFESVHDHSTLLPSIVPGQSPWTLAIVSVAMSPSTVTVIESVPMPPTGSSAQVLEVMSSLS